MNGIRFARIPGGIQLRQQSTQLITELRVAGDRDAVGCRLYQQRSASSSPFLNDPLTANLAQVVAQHCGQRINGFCDRQSLQTHGAWCRGCGGPHGV